VNLCSLDEKKNKEYFVFTFISRHCDLHCNLETGNTPVGRWFPLFKKLPVDYDFIFHNYSNFLPQLQLYILQYDLIWSTCDFVSCNCDFHCCYDFKQVYNN